MKNNSFKTFINYAKSDFNSTGKSNIVRAFCINPIFRFVVLLRLNEYLLNSRINIFLRLIPLLWYKRLGVRLGFSVPLNVFGPGLAIVHYGLLIVNSNSKIGKNCRIHAGVNIGGAAGLVQTEVGNSAPIIGDNCYIGPGAKIFGPIKIGNDCVVGANSVVNKSFETDGVTVGGIPANIISRNSSEGKIINGNN